MRGIAIIGIFLHNYCHWLPGIVKENEYQFFQGNVDGLQGVLAHPDAMLPIHLFSFFGHYGVPVFLFLSAYGLVMKYEKAATPHLEPTIYSFTRYHFLKLFKMMIVGFAAFLLIDRMTPGARHYDVTSILTQLTMTNNMFPEPHHLIWPGPYWFFGLMLQLYVVYRVALFKRHWGWAVALMVVCTAVQVICPPESEELNQLRYNCIGGMLPFCFGLIFARYGKDPQTRLWYWGTLLVAASLVYTQSLSYTTWYIVPPLVCMVCYGLVKVLPDIMLRPLTWMGKISAALFVCHPITRKIIIPVSRHGDTYTGILMYIVTSIALAWLFNEILNRIPNPKKA